MNNLNLDNNANTEHSFEMYIKCEKIFKNKG